jgi:nucleotide-binding universal stress UspA family protein
MVTALLRATLAPVVIRNVLFATDFSDAAAAALPFALAIARRERATLLLTHVLAPEPKLEIPMDPLPAEQDLARLRAQRKMEKLQRSGILRDVNYEPVMRIGNVCDTLAELVAARSVDLIVVGTHGRGGVRKLVLGSCAEKIARAALCPVLSVGPQVAPGLLREGRFQHVLFATEFLSGSLHAWPYAVWLAERDCARLTLVHAVHMPPSLPDPAASAPFHYEEAAAQARRRLQGLLAATGANCEPEILVRAGGSADVVLDAAAERHSSIIVMGVHPSHSGALTHLPWAVADSIIARAPCPVLSVAAAK